VPTEKKKQEVADLADRFQRATIVIGTDFRNLPVNQMTNLRKQLREGSVEYRVVKNRLAMLAAREAGKDALTEVFEGSTGLAIGYGDPLAVTKVLDEYVKSTRSQLVVRSALMDGTLYNGAQIAALAALPSKDELLSKLLGQLQAPITQLATVLSGTIKGLAVVLQRRAEQLA
jgi:large subunit ribosomal protein L10